MSDPLAVISLQQDTPELARAYEQFGIIQFNHGKLLIESLDLKTGEHVLDVGTGTGRLAEYAAELVGPAGRVVGIDPLESRIAIAGLRNSANLSFDTGRAEDLSRFPDRSFDVVYLNSVLHWIDDKARVLQEAFRVLRPGGRIGLTVQDPSAPHESRVLLGQAVAKAGLRVIRRQAQGTTDAELRRLFEAAGFAGHRSHLQTLVETHADVDQLIGWSESSAFGNFLDGYSPAERARVREIFTALVEAKRTPHGIPLARYLRYAFAHKPGPVENDS